MLATFVVDLLAQVPQDTIYIHPGKLLTMIALFAGWVYFAQWVDKDAVAVNTFRTVWNIISIVIGTVAMALLLLLPNFWAALAAYVLIVGAFMIVYVVHRNGLVVEENKVCTPAHIRRLMKEGFGKKEHKLMEVKERVRLVGPDRKAIAVPEDQLQRQVFALVQEVLYDALWRRANLIEVLPAAQATRVRLTVDGVVAEREPMPRNEGDALLLYLKQIAGLVLEERRKPQKGKLNAAVGETRFELVIRTTGSTAGESMIIRALGPEKNFKIGDLGFTPQQLETVREVMSSEKGIVLLTAPPAGGLTTTIHSFARSHDAFLQNIQMLEYEREIDVDNITQKTYAPSDENPFSAELQKLVRTDPNIVLLPELRERAAAVVASETAVRKQIIYVGLHAAEMFDGLRKWLELVGNSDLVSKSLLAVTHQRLLRKLCTACKTPYKPDPATLQKINMPADKVLYRPPEATYDKHGNPVICQGCQGTGYVGRTAVFTVLVVDDELRKVIKSAKSINDIKAAAVKKGNLSLQQQALQKVFEGVTSIDEVVRVTRAAAPAAAAPVPAGAPAAAAPRPAKPRGGSGGPTPTATTK